ncbi:hypothetical protein LINPERHAP2_LOCUS45027 [Linum perenne]
MSLNCLTCSPLQRKNSEREYEQLPRMIKKGNSRRVIMSNPPMAAAFNGDGGEPKLVRSSGMRRDWSFENLRNGEIVFSLVFSIRSIH